MSVIERNDLREVLTETRMLYNATSSIRTRHHLAKQIRRIKRLIARDANQGRKVLFEMGVIV